MANSLSLIVTILYTYTPLLEYDQGEGAIHYTENGRPMRIEFTPNLKENAIWTTFLTTGTNPVGTIVRLPVDGESGFYRLRPE